MFNREDRMANRDLNNQEKKDYASRKDKLIARQVDKIHRYYSGMEKRLNELHEERSALMEARVSREEFRKHAKQALKRAKERALSFYMKHLESTHSKGTRPFPTDRHLIQDYQLHLLGYIALDEKTLDSLVDQLPDGDISEKERDARIAEVNEAIKATRAELDKKLEQSKKSELVIE